MAHCCSEPLQLKTRWSSSQVAGDSTAHTVTIRSTGFMPDILGIIEWIAQKGTKPAAPSFNTRDKPAFGERNRTYEAPFSLEINAEHKPRLVALEISKIEGGARSSRTPPCLKAPGQGQPGAFRQLEIRGRTDKQRLAVELLQNDAFVFSQVARLPADQEARAHLRHHRERGADGGFLLRCACADEASPFRLINQIESRDGEVWNQLPIER